MEVSLSLLTYTPIWSKMTAQHSHAVSKLGKDERRNSRLILSTRPHYRKLAIYQVYQCLSSAFYWTLDKHAICWVLPFEHSATNEALGKKDVCRVSETQHSPKILIVKFPTSDTWQSHCRVQTWLYRMPPVVPKCSSSSVTTVCWVQSSKYVVSSDDEHVDNY